MRNTEIEAWGEDREVGRLHLKLQKMTRLIGGINGSTAISKVGNKNAMDNSQGGFGVNLVYLKNVVLQYMSFEEGSSERIRLIPVISTILKDIESASNGEAASKTSQNDLKNKKSINLNCNI